MLLWFRHSTVIRIVWGIGAGETPSASFDVALAAANVHQYNLRRLSSVIPEGVPLEAVGTAPDLGATGNALNVAMAKQTSQPGARAAAGMAWVRDGFQGPGIFSEVADHDPETVNELLETGITRSCRLRGIDDYEIEKQVVTAPSSSSQYQTAVILAVFGESRPLL